MTAYSTCLKHTVDTHISSLRDNSEGTTDKTGTPYLLFAGELWGVHSEQFGPIWLYYDKKDLIVIG